MWPLSSATTPMVLVPPASTPTTRAMGSALEDDDVAQVPVLLVVVEAVSHHEEVVDHEAGVVDLHLDQAARGLREKGGHANGARTARLQKVHQVVESETGVHDVLGDDEVA